MTVLIAYASRHGATAEIAERIGATLRGLGQDCQVLPVTEAGDPTRFDVVILGSAVYNGRWMKEAAAFARLHQAELTQRPVWLFSSGPVGPRSMPDATDLVELRTLLAIRDHRTFDGALNAQSLSLVERLMVKAVTAPIGDYRQWHDIDSWARTIADSLAPPAVVGQMAGVS